MEEHLRSFLDDLLSRVKPPQADVQAVINNTVLEIAHSFIRDVATPGELLSIQETAEFLGQLEARALLLT